jgi:hypothetical protein
MVENGMLESVGFTPTRQDDEERKLDANLTRKNSGDVVRLKQW